MGTNSKKMPVDTGYSWVILFGSTCTSALIIGNMKSFGILNNEFLRYYGTGAGNTAGIGSLLIFLSFALGIGSGLIMTPAFTILSFYFKERRGLANATFLSGSAMVVILLSYFYKFLIDYYGIHGTLMIIGGMLANVCVFSSFLRQPAILCNRKSKAGSNPKQKDEEMEVKCANQEDNGGVGKGFLINKESTKETRKQTLKCRQFDFSLFKDKQYCLVVLAFTIYSFGHFGNFTIVPSQVAHLGYGKQNVAKIISIIAGVEIIAKLFFGWFTDLGYLKANNIFIILLVVGGVAALGISFLHSFSGYVVYAVIFAAFPLSHLVLLPLMVLDSVSIKKLPRAFGTAALFMSVGYLLSQPLPGWIKDATGTWDNSFRYVGAMNLLAALIIILQPFIVKQSRKNEQLDVGESL